MGCSTSKAEKCQALRLCRERKRLVKEAIDSRYALTAAHLSYLQSLRSIGRSLRRFAEAEVLLDSSLSPEVDKTPSRSSYPSPSPSHNVDSPLPNERPYSPKVSNVSYMKSSASASVTVKLEHSLSRFGDEESFNFPPPPPLPEIDSSWDFFDPSDAAKGSKLVAENGLRRYNSEVAVGVGEFGLDYNAENLRLGSGQRGPTVMRKANSCNFGSMENFEDAEQMPFEDEKDDMNSALTVVLAGNATRGNTEAEKELCPEREDPSELITRRAKDFLSSIKDIENRFFRASESGKEVLVPQRRLPCRHGVPWDSAIKYRNSLFVLLPRGGLRLRVSE